VEGAVFFDRLTGKVFTRAELVGSRIWRHRVTSDAPEAAVRRPHEGDPDLRVEVIGKKTQGVVAERLEALFPLQGRGKPHLSGANPGLLLACLKVARHDDGGEAEQDSQCGSATPGGPGGQGYGSLKLRLLRYECRALARFGFIDHSADAIHDSLAAVRANDLQGSCRIT
jgi:hypothetical protein